MKFSQFFQEAKGQPKVIVVYGGGFQPFHAGHMSSYDQAKRAFPSADFHVAASNDTKNRPIPFKDKQFLAQQAGVKDKFVQVVQPVNPTEILSQYDPKKDILILVRSERDPVNYTKKDGSPAYYQPFKSIKECVPFDPKGGHGYVYVTKKHIFKVNGQEVYSGSQIRSMYTKADDTGRKNMIKDLYPKATKPAKLKQLLDKYIGGNMNESVDELFESLFVEEVLNEGVHDASIFKAVFLAGGPGSGKDYVLDNTLAGHGLTEINSDRALEFMMDKEGLDKKMPSSEEEKRNFVRGRAKTITDLRQRLALLGRNGLIINGTGDDIEKTKKIKAKLEELGYDTKMLLVNTRDEVSAQRNIERGQRGGRAVPETIRKEKWDSVQNSRTEYAKLFGTNYIEFDNSEDLRSADPELVKQKKMELMDIFKNVREFTQAPPKSEPAENWIASEMERKNRFAVSPKQAELSAHADGQGAAADQAHKLGLSYYGFGRYGKQGKVTHHSVNGKLIEVPREKPGEVTVPTTGSSMKKKVNESVLSEAVSVTFTADTIEELNTAFNMFGSDTEVTEEVAPTMSSNAGLNALTLGTYEPPIQEASYAGNIGMMEVMKFHQKATPEQKKEFKSHMANNKHGDAWKLIQDVSGVKLVGKEFESKDKYITDKNGNTRMFMLRRSAAKEAHMKDGEVVQQGKGYVVKLKENRNDEIFQRTLGSQTVSARTSLTEAYSGGRTESGSTSGRNTSSRGASTSESTSGQINEHCGCETEPTKKLTLTQIRERQAEKIKESIDKGIEPGLSMAASGESIGRDMGEKIKKKTGQVTVVEMQGDETGASIGAQKEDELKKKGISLTSFKSNKAIGA